MPSWPDMPAASADRGARPVTISQGKGFRAGVSRLCTEAAGPKGPATLRAMTRTQVPAMEQRTDGEAIRYGCDQPPELLRPRGQLASGERGEGFGCAKTQYCAAMTIDSFVQNQNTGVPNTSACNNYVLGGP